MPGQAAPRERGRLVAARGARMRARARPFEGGLFVDARLGLSREPKKSKDSYKTFFKGRRGN